MCRGRAWGNTLHIKEQEEGIATEVLKSRESIDEYQRLSPLPLPWQQQFEPSSAQQDVRGTYLLDVETLCTLAE